MPRPHLYIIHSAADKALAVFVKSQCEEHVKGLRVFLASNAGDIPIGSEWLTEIQTNLQKATSFLLLLTPRSIERRWVWYEAGAAWLSKKPRFPVFAGGLNPGDIPFPLGATQGVALDDPEQAARLFSDLGGLLSDPVAFCDLVRRLALPPPTTAPDENRIQQIRESFGQFGEPVKLLLRRMLADGGLTLKEMAAERASKTFASDPLSIERDRNTLRDMKLIEGDAEGRWRIQSDARETLQECLYPALSRRMRGLAERMRAWVHGNDGLVDGSAFRNLFGHELGLLAKKAEGEYAVGDPWLGRIPSAAHAVREIANALDRVAEQVP